MPQNYSFSATDRQRKMYISGISGKRPEIPTDLNELEAAAQSAMSPQAFAYIAGGAGIGKTIENNRSAFDQWRIVPRMLRDVSHRDTSVELFGRKLAVPVLLSPVGVLDMAHAEADIAVAKAASTLSIPMIFSNQASRSMESCAAVMGDGPRWFQLYWSKSNELVASLVHRAEASGCEAIVVTLDTTLLGWRIQDLDQGYLPFLRGKGIAQYTSDPVFQRLLDEPETEEAPKPEQINLATIQTLIEQVSNYPGNFWQTFRSKRSMAAVRTFVSIYSRPSLTWENLAFLKEQTSLPIVLKGILHPDDARKALDYGMDGIIVSNHGGRQVDGAIGTLDALPGIVEAVNSKIPVLMDSGVRGGADVFKALALGAKAVCIGRPFVYGLALGGETGVSEVIRNLWADFELTMGLSGCKNIDEINRNMLTPA
ncbi:MAG: lactate 2-monooxygenase [Bacteroidota bacterium]